MSITQMKLNFKTHLKEIIKISVSKINFYTKPFKPLSYDPSEC